MLKFVSTHSFGRNIGSTIRLPANPLSIDRLFVDDARKRPRAKTPIGKLDQPATLQTQGESVEDVYAPFPEGKNPRTGEIGGPRGPEPTRYGDWERKGRVSDF